MNNFAFYEQYANELLEQDAEAQGKDFFSEDIMDVEQAVTLQSAGLLDMPSERDTEHRAAGVDDLTAVDTFMRMNSRDGRISVGEM